MSREILQVWKSLLLTSVLLLTGCAGKNQVYGLGMVDQEVKGDENQVSVWNVYSAGDAYPLAMKHCSKFGKTAVFDRSSMITAYFKCKKN